MGVGPSNLEGLPRIPSGTDRQWLHTHLGELFDEEFLKKQYLHSGFAKLESLTCINTPRPPDLTDQFGTLLTESDELADALVSFSRTDVALRMIHNSKRLSHGILQQGQLKDPFTTVLQLRLHILKCMHVAIQETGLETVPTNSIEELSKLFHDEFESNSLPYDAQMGLKVYFTLLETLLEDGADRDERYEFLDELYHAVQQLEPLSLADNGALVHHAELAPKISSGKKSRLNNVELSYLQLHYQPWKNSSAHNPSSWNGQLPPGHVINSLQDFLAAVCTGLTLSEMGENEQLESRTKALSSLLHLADARGSFRDFLLAAKIVLGIGQTDRSELREEVEVKANLIPNEMVVEHGNPMDHKSTSVRIKNPLPSVVKETTEPLVPVKPAHIGLHRPSKFGLLPVKSVIHNLSAAKARSIPVQFQDGNDEREVWTCGQNSYGELALGDTTTRKAFTQVKMLQGKEIVQVRAGNEHTVALASDGLVYTAGYNDNGQCGQGTTGRIQQLTAIEKLRGQVVTQIHAYNGCEHTLIVTEDGSALSFGYNYRGQLGHGNTASELNPKPIKSLGTLRVTTISCSYYHTVIACDSGELFTFGRNDYGQLGLGDTVDRKLPQKVENLNTPAYSRIIAVGCGQYHTAIVTDTGKLFSFGKNDYGQLGVDSPENQRLPIAVRGTNLDGRKCVQLCCGYYHTIAVVSGSVKASTSVVAFGRNDYGQLGLGHTTQRVYGAQRIVDLDGKQIIKVASGCYHTIAVSESGLMFVFGRNNHGQLGTGDTLEKHSPFAIDTFLGKRIAVVAAGFYHTIILTGRSSDDETQEQSADTNDKSPLTASGILTRPEYSTIISTKAPDPQSNENVTSRQEFSLQLDLNDRDEDISNGRVSPTKLKDGSSALDTIVVLLAQLDRLCSAYIPRNDNFPSLVDSVNLRRLANDEATSTSTDLLFPGSLQLYCIEVSYETFEILASIIGQLFIAERQHTEESDITQVYLLSACLRLLQANIAQLLRSGMGKCTLESRDVQDDSLLTSNFNRTYKQLCRIRSILLDIVDEKTKILKQDHEETEGDILPLADQILQESIKTLMIGFELFYPCSCAQKQLTLYVMENGSTEQLSTGDYCCKPEFPTTAACESLLRPVLSRMADDVLVSKLLIPKNGIASIFELMKSLVEKVSCDTLRALGQNIVSGSSENHGLRVQVDETDDDSDPEEQIDFEPFLKLLRSLQKHLCSWSGNHLDTEPTENDGSIDEYIAATLKELDSEPDAIMHLLQYASLVIGHCSDALSNVFSRDPLPSPIRAVGSTGEAGTTCTLSQRHLSILEKSLLGEILPSLSMTLMLFSDQKQVALQLLPKVTDLIGKLDDLNQQLDESKLAEENFTTALNVFLPGGSRGASSGSLAGKRNEAALGINASIAHDVALPWLFSLEKILCTLAASLASSLVIGDKSSQPEIDQWLNDAKLSGGFETYYLTRTEPLRLHFGRRETQADTFFECLRKDDDKFCESVRLSYSKKDMQYKMLLLQGRNSTTAPLLKIAENTLFAAILKHSNSDIDAATFTATVVPPRFLHLWRCAASLRRWLLTQRNSIQSCQDVDLERFSELCRDVIQRAELLTLLDRREPVVFQRACDAICENKFYFAAKPATSCALAARYDGEPFLKAFPSSKWRLVRIYVHTLARWKRLRKQSTTLAQDSMQPLISKHLPPAAIQCLAFVKTAGTIVVNSESNRIELKDSIKFRAIVKRIIEHAVTAESRLVGLNAFYTLLSTVQLTSPKSDIVDALISVKDYAAKGVCCGESMRQRTSSSFENLFQLLATLIEASTVTEPLLLKLYSCWTVTFSVDKHEFLASVGIFGILRNIISRLLELKQSGTNVKRVKYYRETTWRLFRYLATQLCAQPAQEVDALSTDIQTIAYLPIKPALSSVYMVLFDELQSGIAKMSTSCSPKDLISPKMAGAARRSQELIVAPRRFSSIEPGVSFQADEILSTSKCSDFSITAWVYLTQDSTGGQRVVFIRGNAIEKAPFVLLKDNDRRLEVGIVVDSATEKMTSKTAVPLNRWCHIALVSEANKLRLYINGTLDCQRTNSNVPVEDNLPIYVGNIDGASGFEGSVGQLRYHNRALSPIHVRIVCDQGPPESSSQLDRRCYQMSTVLVLLVESSEGLHHMRDLKWLKLFFEMLVTGTPRVQQLAIRLFYQTLPYVDPQVANELVNGHFIQFLVRTLGISIWKSSIWTENVPEESEQLPNFPLHLSDNMLTTVELGGSTFSPLEASNHSFSIASELCHLLRKLNDSDKWHSQLYPIIQDSFQPLNTIDVCVKVGKIALPRQSLHIAERLCSLCVLGGLSDTLRVGATVCMAQTPTLASLISFEDPNVAQVALSGNYMDTKANGSLDSVNFQRWNHLLDTESSLKSMRLTVDDLRAVSDENSLCQVDAFALLFLSFARDVLSTSTETDVLQAQCTSMTLKILHSLSLKVTSRDLVVQLIALAAENDTSDEFVSLEEVEERVLILRNRFYQLSVGSDENKVETVHCIPNLPSPAASPSVAFTEVDELSKTPRTSSGHSRSVDQLGSFREASDEDDETHEVIAAPELVEELMMMGFPEEWCAMALRQRENDIVSASTWIVDNLDMLSNIHANEVQPDSTRSEFDDEDEEEDEEESQSDDDEEEEDDVEDDLDVEEEEEMVDPVVEETANEAFSEIYFNTEQFGYGCNTETEYGADSTSTGKQQDIGFRIKLHEMTARVAVMSFNQLVSAIKCWERRLSILYARKLLLKLLENDSNGEMYDILAAFDEFPALCKAFLFRGQQFDLKTSQTLDLMTKIFQSDQLNASALTSMCLNDFERSATDQSFTNIRWGSRPLRLGDQEALDDPNVENAVWTFKQLARNGKCTFDAPVFEKLCLMLQTSNVALKMASLDCLMIYLVRWKAVSPLEVIQTAVMNHLQPTRLSKWGKARLNLERSQNRYFHSKYLMNILQVLLFVKRLTSGSSMTQSLPSTMVAEALDPPRLMQCSTNTIGLKWKPTTTTQYIVEISSSAHEYQEVYRGTNTKCTILDLTPGTTYFFRLRGHNTEWSENTRVTTQQDLPFRFATHGPSMTNLRLSEDQLTATYTGSESWTTIFATEPFVVGRNYWEVRIDKSSTSYLFIGIAAKQASATTFLGGDEYGWGYIGDRAIYHRRNKLRAYGDRFMQGDVIGVTLDMDNGTLSYSKNGLDLGVAFDGLAGELYPAVSFYNHHQKVTLLSKSFHCPGAGIAVGGAPSRTTIDDVLDCGSLMLYLCNSKTHSYAIEEAHRKYTLWSRGHCVRRRTRAGYELQFDISDAACSAYGVRTTQRIRTPRGNATVLGVTDDKLWFTVDGESGAWFGNSTDIEPLDTVPDQSDDLNSTVNFETFKGWLEQQIWTAEMDAKMIHAINEHCDVNQLNPWNLTVQQTLEVLPKFSGVSQDAIKGRLSLLHLLNDKISRTLPFFDLSDEFHSKPDELDFNFSALLSHLRGSVFWVTKKRIAEELLAKTATRPKKADDDYDYPEDLPQILLNRPKAAAVACHKDPETRLSSSMFGQAFDELHFLDRSILRIGYSHPMDDGQERAFKAKFEGEGVDDYGGPYRECFSQFALELQAVTSDTQCVLPLFQPSPNWRNAIGDTRDCFIVNPGCVSNLYLEMYNFFGQILGIALRSRVLTRYDFPTIVWKSLVGQAANWTDVEEIDAAIYTLIGHIESADCPPELLDELSFTTTLSNGESVSLSDTADECVTRDNLARFIERVKEIRLSESVEALKAIRDGLISIIPATVLGLFCWYELKLSLCGRSGVDIDLLQANTEYDDDISVTDFFIESFWRVLRSFDENDRTAFLRFVWARSRLPLSSSEFHQKFKIQIAVGEGMTENPDHSLPKAHTCFFSLSLPKYTSDEATRKQILYAIHNCIEMDADFRLAESEMTGWNEIQQSDTLNIT